MLLVAWLAIMYQGTAAAGTPPLAAARVPSLPRVGCTGGWQSLPIKLGTADTLRSIAARSRKDAWVVGNGVDMRHGRLSSLAWRWRGTNWHRFDPPNDLGRDSILTSVAAISTDDVWAVGYSEDRNYVRRSLAEHWDGTGWSIVPTPDVSQAVLTAVSGSSPRNVWAVGNSGSVTLTEHWDGRAWTVVPSPPEAGGFVTGVAVTSPTNAWLVGTYTFNDDSPPFLMRWDGVQWTVVSIPLPFDSFSFLSDISADSTGDAWAVGYDQESGASTWRVFTEHWDGATWSMAGGVSPAAVSEFLHVSARSPTDVWAVGTIGEDTVSGLTEHWDGTSWTVVDDAATAPGGDVVALRSGRAMALGGPGVELYC